MIARSPPASTRRSRLGARAAHQRRVERRYAVVRTPRRSRRTAPTCLPLKGRILRHLGRRATRYVALTRPTRSARATRTSRFVRERTRRIDRASRPRQASRARRPGRHLPQPTIVDADVDLHLDDTVRVFGRVQWQAPGRLRRSAAAAAASSGGCRGMWCCARRAAVLAGLAAPRARRRQRRGRVRGAGARSRRSALRYLDFAARGCGSSRPRSAST